MASEATTEVNPRAGSQRLKWAKGRENWMAEDFEGVIWSDECSVQKSDDARQVWVFRTPSEKGKPECIAPKKGQRGVGDGMELIFGGKSWNFLSLCCEIGECKSVPQVAGVPSPFGRAAH